MTLTKMDINAEFEFVPTENGRYYYADEVDKLITESKAINELEDIKEAVNHSMWRLFCHEGATSEELLASFTELSGNMAEHIKNIQAEIDEFSENYDKIW